MQEINGFHTNQTDEKTGKPKLLSGFSDCKDDGGRCLRRMGLLGRFTPATTTIAHESCHRHESTSTAMGFRLAAQSAGDVQPHKCCRANHGRIARR